MREVSTPTCQFTVRQDLRYTQNRQTYPSLCLNSDRTLHIGIETSSQSEVVDRGRNNGSNDVDAI